MRAAPLFLAVAALALTACAPDPPAGVVGLAVDSCDPGIENGAGIVVAPGLALTSAHVVAGGKGISVHHADRAFEGTIVGFDPEMDLAYVAFEPRAAASLDVDSDRVEPGDHGVAWVVREGEIVDVPVTIRRRVNIRTEDIYIQGETLRPGYELDADIRSGDSGAAVVVGGKVVGVIWARSTKFDDRAYAIDPERAGDLIDRQLRTGELGPDVDITRCH